MLKEVEVVVDEYLLKVATRSSTMNGNSSTLSLGAFSYRRLERPLQISGIDVDPRSRYRPYKKRMTLCMSNIRSQSIYEVDGNTPEVVINGILHRLFYEKREIGSVLPVCANNVIGVNGGKVWVCPATRNPDFAKTFTPYFKVAELFGDVAQLTPMTPEEFVSGYKGAKRRQYEQAARKFRQMPEITAKHFAVNTFPKYEKVGAKAGRDVRIIQPRSYFVNVALGIYLKVLEHHLYSDLNRMFKHEVVMKGKNAVDTAAIIRKHWDEFDSPVFVGLDASRFDQHIHVSALKFEHSIYQHYFRDHPELKRLLSYQLKNVGYAKFPTTQIRYEIHGTRMSGDMNTSMGNVALMCCMCLVYMRTHFPFKYRYINNGDDCGFIIEREHLNLLDNIPKVFDMWGFPMTVEAAVDIFERIEFCQTRPVYDGTRYIMVRDPIKCITKDQIICQPVTSKEHFDQHRKSVSDCGLAICGNIPVMSSFYKFLGRGANPKHTLLWDQATGLKWQSLGLKPIYDGSVSDASRYSFFLAYGIMPHTQLLLESYFDSKTIDWDDQSSNLFHSLFVHSVS